MMPRCVYYYVDVCGCNYYIVVGCIGAVQVGRAGSLAEVELASQLCDLVKTVVAVVYPVDADRVEQGLAEGAHVYLDFYIRKTCYIYLDGGVGGDTGC